jgi:hypothetical protein
MLYSALINAHSEKAKALAVDVRYIVTNRQCEN